MESNIDAIRRYNRFFTRQVGVLREKLLHTPYSLTEARILFEIAHSDTRTASDLAQELGLDTGYISRILSKLDQQGLITKTRAVSDGRQFILRLTLIGEKAFSLLDQRSRHEVAEILNELSEKDQEDLLKAMCTIESILSKKKLDHSNPFYLRTHEPGDMGWVTHRHGVLYAKEYGWDENFEALVAQITADFIKNYNPTKERCWIAEVNGEIVGSVFVVQSSETVAKLRLLLVEPKARGLGLGTHLVDECIRFARRSGFHKLELWTNSVLVEARHIYEKAGFTLIVQEAHHSFGQDLVGENWELIL